MSSTDAPPVTLTIAGSDSGGGAGIQADLKAMTSVGVHGVSAITALTAQNSTGVQGIHPVPPEFLEEQINSVTSDFPVLATKTGMLFSRELITVICDRCTQLGRLVVDPVMVAESGDSLLDPEAQSTLVQDLLPLADVITPNGPEIRVIADQLELETNDLKRLTPQVARALDGPNVLLKGGHLEETEAVDYLYNRDGDEETFSSPRHETNHTHGSGCAYSSLIASFLAKGYSLIDAITESKNRIDRAIKDGYAAGAGSGTLNFLS